MLGFFPKCCRGNLKRERERERDGGERARERRREGAEKREEEEKRFATDRNVLFN